MLIHLSSRFEGTLASLGGRWTGRSRYALPLAGRIGLRPRLADNRGELGIERNIPPSERSERPFFPAKRASASDRHVGVRARRGISLMEAVVAITIVGITSVAALEAVGGDMRTAERARRAIELEALATSRLEFMDLMTDRELQALPDSVESGKFPAPLDEYSWKTTSAPVADLPGVYDVRVAIDWSNGEYVVKTYQYRQPPIATRR